MRYIIYFFVSYVGIVKFFVFVIIVLALYAGNYINIFCCFV